MSLILNIESSTKTCSVSLAKEGEVIAIKELNDVNYSHAEKLHPFIAELFDSVNININAIDAVAVSKGPGSYTGLRIGVSAAKGFCFALSKPLISVETLKSLAHTVIPESGYIIPMLDARRMEVYSAVFDVNYNLIRATKAEIIDDTSFYKYLNDSTVYFIGDGVSKTREVIKSSNAIFIDDIFPSSKEMAKLSYQKFIDGDFEDVAYFEPFYLKDFIVTPQKKKV